MIDNAISKYYKPMLKSSYEFSCAKISFCPDLCCGKAYQRGEKNCKFSKLNPCNEINDIIDIGDGSCHLSTTNNKDIFKLKQNLMNVTCECPLGKKYSHSYRTCIDIDECAELNYECNGYKQVCLNTIGSYECICEHGYKKNKTSGECEPFTILDDNDEERVYESDVALDELKSLNFAQRVFH